MEQIEQEIYALKRAVIELEKNIYTNGNDSFHNTIDKIIDITSKLKKMKTRTIEEENKRTGVSIHLKYNKINTLPFLYKPINRRNYYDGDYLVKFAEDRTRDLKDAKALDAHNKFWIEHKTVKGNIFGSLPTEFLNEKEKNSLYRNGWRDVSVDILDMKGDNTELRDVIKFCEESFNYYILIKEEQTNSYLILKYNI